MKAILQVFSFLACAILTGFSPAGAATQAAGPGACAFLGRGMTLGFSPMGALSRFALLQRTIRCLQSHAQHAAPAANPAADGAQFVTFDPPGSTLTMPSGITPEGVITGYFCNTAACANNYFNGGTHGFLRTPNGTITTFDPPGSVGTIVTSINPAGEIAGTYCNTAACTPIHGFVRNSNGTFTTFDAPAGSNGILGTIYNPGGPPPSINPAGAVAGSYSVSVPTFTEHGFLRTRGGTFTTFDVPGSTFTEALDMNPSGTIVGDFNSTTVFFAGFLRDSGREVHHDQYSKFLSWELGREYHQSGRRDRRGVS